MNIKGHLHKMQTEWKTPVEYSLLMNNEKIILNNFIGKKIKLTFSGQINCVACGRKIKKSYQQGYCFPCTQKLAECDLCILKPELCHYAQGTCREPAWGESHCMQSHIVYLANTTGVKVGITRESQIPTRWMDQGAVAALPVMRVKTRKDSGDVEIIIASKVADKTQWQKMLQGDPAPLDLKEIWGKLREELPEVLALGEELALQDHYTFEYPVTHYPTKVKSMSFDKTPEISDVLIGIKGQYLIFENGVLNIRGHQGYYITLEELS